LTEGEKSYKIKVASRLNSRGYNSKGCAWGKSELHRARI